MAAAAAAGGAGAGGGAAGGGAPAAPSGAGATGGRRGAGAAAAAAAATDEGPPEIDATMRPLLEMPGVVGYFVVNEAGIPIKWSATGFEENVGNSGLLIPKQVTHFAALVSDLVVKAQDTCHRLFAEEDPDDTALRYIRLRTNDSEIIVAPGDGTTLVVIQRPHGLAKTGEKAEGGEGGEAKDADEA